MYVIDSFFISIFFFVFRIRYILGFFGIVLGVRVGRIRGWEFLNVIVGKVVFLFLLF